MHWGHATSDNADPLGEPRPRRGDDNKAFSGSAVDDNGVPLTYHTGPSGSMVQVMTIQFAKYNVWLPVGMVFISKRV